MATLLFVGFSKAFDSKHKGKVMQVLLAYGLPKETVTVIIMLDKNMKTMVCSPDGDLYFLEILPGNQKYNEEAKWQIATECHFPLSMIITTSHKYYIYSSNEQFHVMNNP